MSITVSGGYNEETDRKSIQKIKLENLVVKLSGAKNEKEKVSAMNIDLLEDIYEDARDDDRLDEIEDALDEKYDGDELKREYLLALIRECSKIQEVTLEEIKALARNRSLAIKSYLVDVKGVNPLRVSEIDIGEVAIDETALVKSKLDVVIK